MGPDWEIDLPNRKLAGLLVYLACSAPTPQPREKLSTLLCGSHFEVQARQNLRQALFRLRRLLGPDVVIGDGEEVALAPGAIDCDARRLEALIREGGRDSLKAAVDLYNGQLLADVNIREEARTTWFEGERQRFEGLALNAMLRLGDLELKAGRFDRALAAANKALSINEFREDAHRLLIRALAAAGRRADALNHYKHLDELLKRELKVEPDGATKQLIEDLRRMAASVVAKTSGGGFVGPAVTKSEALVPATSTVNAATRPAPMMALALPDKPSIAVLPFDNMSGDPEQGYFADGMVEEIITALSRIRWLFVIARNSSFTYKGRTIDVKQVGRELGVRYLLEGSVRKAGERVRITGQLIDALTGTHLWADRFDGSLENVFDLQANLTESQKLNIVYWCRL